MITALLAFGFGLSTGVIVGGILVYRHATEDATPATQRFDDPDRAD
jgi:hypothetical protein